MSGDIIARHSKSSNKRIQPSAGTRITVDLILEKLGNGESIEAVLESHPRLTREGVLAALRFAAQALRAEVVYPVSARSA